MERILGFNAWQKWWERGMRRCTCCWEPLVEKNSRLITIWTLLTENTVCHTHRGEAFKMTKDRILDFDVMKCIIYGVSLIEAFITKTPPRCDVRDAKLLANFSFFLSFFFFFFFTENTKNKRIISSFFFTGYCRWGGILFGGKRGAAAVLRPDTIMLFPGRIHNPIKKKKKKKKNQCS